MPQYSASALAAALLAALLSLCIAPSACAQTQPTQPAQSTQPEGDDVDQETPWPYQVKDGNTTFTIYQPQLDSWDGYKLQARAAVSVAQGDEDSNPVYGIIHVTASTLVNKADRIVTLDRYQITKAEFPTAQKHSSAWVQALQKDANEKSRTLSLDRLEANLHIVKAQQATKQEPI
jgi:hypothetical protein